MTDNTMPKYTETAAWKDYLALMTSRPDEFRQAAELQIITDSDTVNRFVADTGRRVGVMYRSPWNIFVADLVQDANGTLFTYDRLLAAATGMPVVTIPVTAEGRFILLNQFRHALRTTQWGFPRGFGEDGLTAKENACKELSEELGATVDPAAVRQLGTMYSDGGMSGSGARVVLCPVSSYQLQTGHEGIIETVSLTAAELNRWIADGTITDGFTLSAWMLYEKRTSQEEVKYEI